MSELIDRPIGIDVTSAGEAEPTSIRIFSNYFFERNILTPAASFRFTAAGVDRADRLAIRSGDMVEIFVKGPDGSVIQLGTGYIDETDTHITKDAVEYSISGRDTASALVDNDAVDEKNAIIFVQEITIAGIARKYIRNTRLARTEVVTSNCPNGLLRLQTNVGETKMNSLQRYAEYCNCLIWTKPTGQLVVGRPNMAQKSSGSLITSSTVSTANNCLEARAKRNVNQAIRRLAVQLQALNAVDPTSVTISNMDADVRARAKAGVGTSKFMVYSLGNGLDAVNTLENVGSDIDGNNSIGRAYARRHLAMENMKVLDVEAVVQGHFNENGLPYNIDQIYDVIIEDDDVNEPMYVYGVSYELSMERGLITKLKLCRLGTIVADVGIINQLKPLKKVT